MAEKINGDIGNFDVLVAVLSYLEPEEAFVAAQVCSWWRKILQSESMQQQIAQNQVENYYGAVMRRDNYKMIVQVLAFCYCHRTATLHSTFELARYFFERMPVENQQQVLANLAWYHVRTQNQVWIVFEMYWTCVVDESVFHTMFYTIFPDRFRFCPRSQDWLRRQEAKALSEGKIFKPSSFVLKDVCR